MTETFWNEWRNRRINECMNFELIDLTEWMNEIDWKQWMKEWLTDEMNEIKRNWHEMKWNGVKWTE